MEASSQPAPASPESRARDHLANERTYLAWLRTAINVMVLGIVIAKFIKSEGSQAEIAGALLIAVGLALLIYGTVRSRQISDQLERGEFTVDHGGPLVVAIGVAAAVVAAFLILFL